jgi:hypothetical protein
VDFSTRELLAPLLLPALIILPPPLARPLLPLACQDSSFCTLINNRKDIPERLVAHELLSNGSCSEDEIEAMLASRTCSRAIEKMFTREGSFVDADGFMSRSSFIEAARILVHEFERVRSGSRTIHSSEYRGWIRDTQGICRKRRPLPRNQADWQRRHFAAAARDGQLFRRLITHPLQVCILARRKLPTRS